MTNMRIISCAIPEEIDRKILDLKKSPEFERCTYSEVLRRIILLGIDTKFRTEGKGG